MSAGGADHAPKPARPVAAARAIVLHRDQVLFLTASEDAMRWYFLPGGGVMPGERLEDAAKREVLEETGVHIVVERALYVREFIAARHHKLSSHVPPGRHAIAMVFLARPDPAFHKDLAAAQPGCFPGDVDGSGGVTGLCWISLADCARLDIRPPHLKLALSRGFPPAPEAGLAFWPEEEA